MCWRLLSQESLILHEVWNLYIPATLPDVQRCQDTQLLLLCFIGCKNKSNALVQGWNSHAAAMQHAQLQWACADWTRENTQEVQLEPKQCCREQ